MPRFIPLASAVLLSIVGAPRASRADHSLHLDVFGALPLGGWQSAAFGAGAGVSGSFELAASPRLGWITSAGYTALSTRDGALPTGLARPGVGGYADLTTGLRLRPFGRMGAHGEGLWIDLQGGGALTGGLLRPTVSARAGFGFTAGGVSLGPWIGGVVVVQTDSQGIADDAHIAMAGVEVSIGGRRVPRALPVEHPVVVAPHRCPAPAAHTLPDTDGDGCLDDDTDGDGIRDRVDHCVDAPEDIDGFEDADGCPDPDNDHDGIPDSRDRCPNDPEELNGVDDDDGCPDILHLEDGHVVLDDRVHFDFDSASVDPSAGRILEALVRLMAAHPEYGVLSVEGHADDRGSDDYNDRLSYQRARAVADQLTAIGLPGRRVLALGFGRRSAIVHGIDEVARGANRRVEFFVDGHRSQGLAVTARGYREVGADGELHHVPSPEPGDLNDHDATR